MAARQMEEAPDTLGKGDSSPNKSGEWRESDSGIEWIAKSAEKVKAAEEQRKEAAKESTGESSKDEGDSADKSIDGASILEDEETFTKGVENRCLHLGNFCAFRDGGLGGGGGEDAKFCTERWGKTIHSDRWERDKARHSGRWWGQSYTFMEVGWGQNYASDGWGWGGDGWGQNFTFGLMGEGWCKTVRGGGGGDYYAFTGRQGLRWFWN